MRDVTNGKLLSEMLYDVVGIYALHLEGKIIYVGQTNCIRKRIDQHMTERTKDFDGYSFASLLPMLERMNYPTGKKYMDWVEAWEIRRARPSENRLIPNIHLTEHRMHPKLLKFCRIVSERGHVTENDFAEFDNTQMVGGSAHSL